MNDFRWNTKIESRIFWDSQEFSEHRGPAKSDKEIIGSLPAGMRFEDILRSLCRVVSELVELEEKRK